MTEAIRQDPKKRRIFYIIILLLALIISVWVGSIVVKRYRAKKKLDEEARGRIGNDNLTHDPGDPGMNSPELGDAFPLIKGSKGENVQYLQRALNTINKAYGKSPIAVDGTFGQGTYNAVVSLGTKYVPVTQTAWTEILNRANKLSA